MRNGYRITRDKFFSEKEVKRLLKVCAEKAIVDKLKGRWIGAKMSNFFRELTPKNFVYIANKFKVEYVIIETNHSRKFHKFEPIFTNKKVKIYKISDFQEI